MKTLGIATRSAPAEVANGDRAFHLARGEVHVFGVIDGLGHGPKAEEAALAALVALEAATQHDVRALFAAAHEALRGTRGAAMTLVVVEHARCEAAGVGNVTLWSRQVRGLSLASTPGVVGAQMRSLRLARGDVEQGARLVIASDGISSRASVHDHAALPPDVAARRILELHSVPHDDATILVVDL